VKSGRRSSARSRSAPSVTLRNTFARTGFALAVAGRSLPLCSGLSPLLTISSKLKRVAVAVVQLAITFASLYYLFRDPQKRHEMAVTITRARGQWVLAGIAVYGVVELLAALRWKLLLDVQGIVIRPVRVWTLLLISVFFNFVIPGGTGGDVVRTFYLLKEAPGRKGPAVLSVLMDLIVGLFALVLLTVGCVAFRWSWLTSTPSAHSYVVMALLLLAGCTGVIVFSFIASGFGLVHKLPQRMPGRERIAEFALAYYHYARAWPATLIAILGSVFCQLGYFAIFYCAGRALETPADRVPTLGEMCTIMPFVNTITSLPISLGGLGVREGLFQVFLHQLCGVEPSLAVVISSLGFLLTAVWGAIGGILYAFYRPSEHAKLGAMRDEMKAMEHTVAEEEIELELAEEEERR